MKKKLVILLISICLILGQTMVTEAKTAPKFDRAKAIEYAEANWENDGGDCVKFVRAVMEYAGVVRDAKKTTGYTSEQYANYLIKNARATKYELKWSKNSSWYYIGIEDNADIPIEPGDVLLYECTNPDCPKPLLHMAIVAESKDGNYWYLYQHNPGRNIRAVAYTHKKCGADPSMMKVYVLHIDDSIPYEAQAENVQAVLDTNYNQVKFSFDATTEADGYNVYYKKSADENWTELAKETTKTSFVVSDLAAGATYQFKVTAVKDGKESISPVTKKCTTLKSPVISSIKTEKSKAKLTWKKVSGITGYEISQSKVSGEDNVVATYKTTSGTYKVIAAKKGVKYFYKIRAYKVVGDTTIYGPWSKEKAFTRK